MNSNFQMIDVGNKEATARTAFARGTIILSARAYRAIENGNNPKGDVLALAELTAILGAKNAASLLPLCHPLPIEKVRVYFEKDATHHTITIFTEVSTTAKTGVEMEALAAVNAGLLGIYDLSKAVDPILELSDIRLDRKIGGKSGDWKHPKFIELENAMSKKITGEPLAVDSAHSLAKVNASVLTLSDRCFKGEAKDTSGPAIEKFLSERGAVVTGRKIVPDEEHAIREAVLAKAGTGNKNSPAHLLVLTGGTGVSERDITPETLKPLWTKEIPGIGELLRSSGAEHTAMSYLSRSGGGFIGNCLVICLPGSEKAVQEGMLALLPILPHLLHVKSGGGH
jgi:cyclic pyranopterin phosphate synthase